MPVIKTINLGKRYGNFWAVRELNLRLRQGEIYGFLGPNGAGKTTTILMILGVIRPSAGEIRLFSEGMEPAKPHTRLRIGAVTEYNHLHYAKLLDP
jgi:ABC-type multidrug transport system ATPase subunit